MMIPGPPKDGVAPGPGFDMGRPIAPGEGPTKEEREAAEGGALPIER